MIETKLNNLEINELTEKQFDSAKESGELNPVALYMTPSVENISDVLPIIKGGTNAQTAGEARINLGFEYGEEVPTHIPETGDGAVYFKIDDEDDGVTPIEHGGTGAVTGYDGLRNLGAMDYVIEQGVSGIWTYRKWASGIAECWGVNNAVVTNYSSVNGFYGYYVNITFPSNLFNTSPIINFSGMIGAGFVLAGTVLGITASGCRTYALSTSSGSVSTSWNIIAKGRWK